MYRTLVSVIGLVLVVIPRSIVETAENVVFENPDDITVKSWVIPGTRVLRIIVFVLTVVSLRGEGDE